MPEHIIINDETNVYECLNCGFKSEPPWMTPLSDIAQDARDHFIAEHKDCQAPAFGANDGRKRQ
jgi:hypothetical protein